MTAVSDIEGNYPNLVQTCGERGDWFPLCDSEWTLQDANVVCRELEYSYVGKQVLNPLRPRKNGCILANTLFVISCVYSS